MLRVCLLWLLLAYGSLCITASDLFAAELAPAAEKLLTAYESNFQIAQPFQIVVRRFGHEAGKEILTGQRILRGMDARIEFQFVGRLRSNSGTMEEFIEKIVYDGKETFQLNADFAGVKRELTPVEPRGVRAQISSGRLPSLERVLELPVLEMRPFVIDLPWMTSYRECAKLARTIEHVAGERPKLILKMPDTTNSFGVSYSSQEIELEFDREHSWWIKNATFRATKSQNKNKYTAIGRIEIMDYQQLKDGGFFPKSIQVFHNANPELKEQKGPRLEIVSLTINPDPPLKAIEIKCPVGLVVTREIAGPPGSPKKEQIIVLGLDGTRQTFESADAYEDFQKSAASNGNYKGAYVPDAGFDYLYTTIEAVKKIRSEEKRGNPNPPERKKPWYDVGSVTAYGSVAMVMNMVATGAGVLWRRRVSAR